MLLENIYIITELLFSLLYSELAGYISQSKMIHCDVVLLVVASVNNAGQN